MSVGYRQLGTSGLTVSTVGLGCSNLGRPGTASFTQEGTDAVVRAALDAGITLFDVADTYGTPPGLSERLLGEALKGHRDDVVIATKFGMDAEGANGRDFGVRGSRRYIVRAVEESLRRLGTDRIDLYQFHTPDPVTPIEETLAALDTLVRQGKVLYLGHSNFAGWQIAQAEYLARQLGTTRFVASQNQYNLLDRRAELEVLPAARAFGLGVLPYYPLASGLLTGKYSSGKAPEGSRLTHFRQDDFENADLAQLAAFGDFARKRGLDEVQVAFSWLASRPAVASVIAGATRPGQVAQNAAAAGYEFGADDLAELDEIFPPLPPIALF
ncbi:aldo/keto reductase [Streptomyces diastatochromogenes]|uniref:Aldo/keto reductase n=1 Tax=Streptomyces diastatochromogenes TaxID=42236 RepID=A0A233RXA7_STRDA|nr:aldo/keto reductase [Streptomyces diastatochromogenes]MCZ0985434.1 aldo/keto reductase [Streptomyces diastatochromogenes]OXY87999.1 aldo/keto reductase [Streptomyces diastatochromogenes]